MRKKNLLTLFLSCLSLINATSIYAVEEKLALTLDAIFASEKFQNQTIQNIQWKTDSSSFRFAEKNALTGLLDVHEYNIASGARTLLVSGDELQYKGKALESTHFQWTPSNDYLLISGSKTITWDNEVESPYYIYSAASKKVTPLANDNPALRNVHLSPDGLRVGYVLDNNIYIAELASGVITAVTSDGSTDIFNGIFDYGSSEFGFPDAWHWSPDSKKIAFWRLDTTDIKVFYMVDELGKYNKVNALKYPNVGERHAVNQIGVFDLKSSKTAWMDIGENADDYIPQISWTRSSSKLAIQRLTRDHENLDLLFANTNTGKSQIILTDRDPAWVDIGKDLMFYEEKNRFVWTSEKSGYRHAYLYDYKGKEVQLTSGNWEISSLIELDEKSGWLYFYAKKASFIDQHVYRVKLDGSKVEKLSKEPGWYDWQFSPDHQLVIETHSDARTPQSITLKNASGEKIRMLEENKLKAMQDYAMPHTEFIKIETSDGISIDAYMIKPLNFDPTKKYPVIGYGYGNAGSQVVVNRWGTQRGPRQDLWHRYMAEQGYIIVAIDNRTTAGRGKAAKNLTYGHYGKYAILDYLEGVKYLKSLPYIDAARLGFWGWSGGGYLAAALMTLGAPHFKTAVSVAPVIDLSTYQAVGVERWMDSIADNPKGYDEVNLINYADKLEGNLLLIHGSGDENVKFAFTLQFANALIAHNKQFDMMVYPNRHHGISDAQLHVFTKIANYFLEKL
ncbi:MAG: dipeptidyl-peptidase-4 [Gammaproteobacteria bacterium]|jgi:dipeptidyl-peptidase-4